MIHSSITAPRPTSEQLATTRAVVQWYLDLYYSTDADLGLLSMFCNPARVGHFAVNQEDIATEQPDALFKLLVTVAMFQRLRDSHVMGILRGISAEDAADMTSVETLLALAQGCTCPHSHSNKSLIQLCDLTKKPETKRGTCTVAPELPCYLKHHTELLRRYGHFGKVPTSAALVISEHGDLAQLRVRVLTEVADPLERAQQLEMALSKAWRISEKLSAMYLSLLTVPNLGLERPPWQEGIDWRYFVVVDRNVDAFLTTINYSGSGTYTARRTFVQALAEGVNLSALRPELTKNNPRLVQQAFYLFMSEPNRRTNQADCCQHGDKVCAKCPSVLSEKCPTRR